MPATNAPDPTPREEAPTPAQNPIPEAIRRLMEEVKLDQPTHLGLFDRAHNRHNRS
jgi:hypothetical protein